MKSEDDAKGQKLSKSPIFTKEQLLHYTVIFASGLIILNLLVKFLCTTIFRFHCPWWWPVSVVKPYFLGFFGFAVLVITIVIFYSLFLILEKVNYDFKVLLVAGNILVVMSNLIQGVARGLKNPTDGNIENNSIQYFHDAIKLDNLINFVSNFNDIQLDLLMHSKTHPPGAVLVYYLLHNIIPSPLFISLAIAVISTSLTLFFIYQLFSIMLEYNDSSTFNKTLVGYASFLFILLPAIQIYYLATIDALIATTMIGALYFFLHENNTISIIGTSTMLFLASFMSFIAVFMLGVMFSYEFFSQNYYMKKSFSTLLLVILGYLTLFILVDFSYIQYFIDASSYENSAGIFFLDSTLEYLITRIEGILEIMVFLGPFLLILIWRGIDTLRKNKDKYFLITVLATLVLGGMFLVGLFRTGETARIAMFYLPFLWFPLLQYFDNIEISFENRKILATLVFSQTLIMQSVGFYFW